MWLDSGKTEYKDLGKVKFYFSEKFRRLSWAEVNSSV